MQKDLLPGFLHLFHCFGAKRARLLRLLEHFQHNPFELINASQTELLAAGLKGELITEIKKPLCDAVAQDLDWAKQDENYLISYNHASYPTLLKQIDDYPPLLYARGDIELLSSAQIAIVGSRLCTPGGAQTALEFSSNLAGSGFTITSGMALGIDSNAHRGALRVEGKTIAVMATGLDRIYPASNHKLALQIVDNGLIISEFALGTKPKPYHFPQRNRIISGLSVATLVVEAAARSGSLITARLANEQGREVFAIPGSIHNPQARGCHRLIRDGAKLVDKVSDIHEELDSLLGFVLEQQISLANTKATVDTATKTTPTLDKEHQLLLDLVGYDPIHTDILVRRSGLTIDKLSSMLLLLELNDLIQSASGGCFVRI